MIPILFFIFLAVTVIGVCIVAYNFVQMSKRMSTSIQKLDFNSTLNNMSSGMTTHIIGGLVGAAGMIGTIVTGIIWIIQAIKA